MKLFSFLLPCILCFCTEIFAQSSARFDLWKKPSYFRGFNLTLGPPLKNLQDFIDVSKTGANIAYLCCDGFRNVDTPYTENTWSIQVTDDYISYCHANGMYYTLAIRGGPGRRDVYLESQKMSKSTVWKNPAEQQLYGSMLREIVQRYKDDTLFVGIVPTNEPDPLFDSLYFDTTSLKKLLTRNGVDMYSITKTWVDSIRSVSKDIPILIQGPAYGSPEFMPLSPIIDDPFIVYEFHCYRPHEYVYAADTSTLTYPGTYISYLELKLAWFDKAYLKDTIFRYINARQKETGAPIFMGEFGLEYPQKGGDHLLGDLSSICIENGWHFAYWEYHAPSPAWNYDQMPQPYSDTILKSLHHPTSWVKETPSPNNEFTLSPNPCSQGASIRISLNGDENTETFFLFDILGRTVRELRMNGNPVSVFNCENILSGEYLAVIKSRSGYLQKRLLITK
ncbi:MAG: cellulase family glycosylhydrolase [Candidatus Kapaibacterium sp.]